VALNGDLIFTVPEGELFLTECLMIGVKSDKETLIFITTAGWISEFSPTLELG
jgi:hypothetical protein